MAKHPHPAHVENKVADPDNKAPEADIEIKHEVIDGETGEILKSDKTSTDVAVHTNGDDFAVATAAVKVVRRVTIPLLQFPEGQTITAKIVAPIYTGKEIPGHQIKKAAELVQIDSRSGVRRLIIVNEVLKKELNEAYPDDGYVGKWFMITKIAPKDGKRYPTFDVQEVEFTA